MVLAADSPAEAAPELVDVLLKASPYMGFSILICTVFFYLVRSLYRGLMADERKGWEKRVSDLERENESLRDRLWKRKVQN